MFHEEARPMFDESRPGKDHPLDSIPFKEYMNTARDVVTWSGEMVLDYTVGKPGEQLSSGGWKGPVPIDWRPNTPFDAVLTVRRLETGRSAVRIWLEDESSRTLYPMFGHTLIEALAEATDLRVGGKIGGTWIVVKKGSNYGVELYTP